MPTAFRRLVFFVTTTATATALSAATHPATTRATADYVPDVAALARPASSELRELVERYVTDRKELERFYSVHGSELHQRRLREFLETWQARLTAVDFERLGVEGRIDHTLLRTLLGHELTLIGRETARAVELAPLVPLTEGIASLQESRRLLQPVDGKAAATTLDRMRKDLDKARAGLAAGLKAVKKTGDDAKTESASDEKSAEKIAPITVTKVVAYRAAGRIPDLKKSLEDWFKHFDAYDPQFGWWTREPHRQLATALDDYAKFLREKIVGIDPADTRNTPIIGDPIGRDGLKADLAQEMIAYTPEELLAIAEREFAWCDAEWKRVAHDMGLGDDWKAALEKTKQDYLAPGEQPAFIRDLALEAVKFVQDRDLVTIPPLAADMWRMQMMTREAQKVNPFFLGGNDILVSFPTDAMEHSEKLDSLRANNRHFARATVFHELLPGHHLQYFYMARVNQHRELFETPFWIEGWALWWEFYLWDLGFPQSPENRAGMLFWRSHRCARIIFSLNFHLGKWTPQQCIDFLVSRVGHDVHTATGEVRRSLLGMYSPLYQAGYMLGALQIRDLHRQLVGTGPGKLTDKQFHDAIMLGGPMPIEMVRAHVMQTLLPRDFTPAWKF